jgi:hypothetical protein
VYGGQVGIALRISGATAAVVAIAVPAVAQGAIVKRSDSARLDTPREVGTATAQCPGGALAAGGGYKLSSNRAGAPRRIAQVFESRKQGQDAWTVRAMLGGDSPAPARLTAFAYCDTRGRPTTTVTTDGQTTQSNEVKTVVPRCTGSKNAQGGGFSTPPPFYADGSNAALNVISGSTPAGKTGWRIQVTAGFSFSPFISTFTGHAYCANGAPPQKRAGTKSIKPNANNPSEFGKGSAKSKPCPKDVVGGGFSQRPINPSGGLESSFLNVHAAAAAGARWKASATQGGLQRSRLKAIALCS